MSISYLLPFFCWHCSLIDQMELLVLCVIFIFTSFFFWQLQLNPTIELFICLFVCGHVSFYFILFWHYHFYWLDSWIYLSTTCLLDYNPIEVLIYYACPFDGIWKSTREYLALTRSCLDGVEMLACGLATHFVLFEVFTHLQCFLEWNHITNFLHMACTCTW